MDFDAFLGEMQKLITASQQGDLFGNKKVFASKAMDTCEDFLKTNGYGVRKPIKYPDNINRLDDLINLFYTLLKGKYPDYLTPYSNTQRDRAIAKKFVTNRMEQDNISRADALKQCGSIIRTVFNSPHIFKFESPPTFGIFGQAEMGWITDRSLQIINDSIKKDKATAAEKAADRMTKEISENYKDIGYSL